MRVGLDIGATKVLGAVIEADGTVVAQSRQKTLPGADGILDTATTVLDSLAIALDGVLPSHIGIGVGAGLVVGGALVQGHAWAAGEIGHVVVDAAGVRCACGKVGCLETILSVPHLRDSDRPLASVGIVLGEALAPVVGALNLHEVVLAGPPDLLDGELREALDATVRDRVMEQSAADLVVRMSPLGDDVVLVGAAVLVLSGELGVS